MADIRAAQSGDFSATATWVGGVVPGSGDVAYANTFTVTISDTRTVQAISNASGTSITAGGTFSLLNGCNLTCTNANGVVQGATVTNCVTTPSLALGSTATVAANVTAAGNGGPVYFSGSGTLDWIGNITAMSGVNDRITLQIAGTGTLNVTGILTGASNNATDAMRVNGNANITISGECRGGNGPNSYALRIDSVSNVTISGNVIGGGGSSGAIVCQTGATLTVNGICQSGTGGPAINAGSVAQITRLSGPFLLGAANITPVLALTWRWAPTQIPTYMEVPTSGGATKRNLFTSDNIPTANYPTVGNVRSGTVYGPNLENTGTLAVPAAGSVALGVPVDNTTGTAVLTSANVQTALGAFSSGRLNNVATVDSTGAQIQAAVSA